MKYKLSRPEISKELAKVLSKAIKLQMILVRRASVKMMKELAVFIHVVEKQGLPKNLVCKKLPMNMGSGIFLHPNAKPIPKGTLIGVYAGKIILTPQNFPDESAYAFAAVDNILFTREEQKLFDRERAYHPRRLYSYNIDAENSGNFTRFINHSEKPNIISDLVRIPKNSLGIAPSPIEVVYLANKTIHPGEQLLVSYEGEENSYWNVLKIKPVYITPKTFRLSPSLEIIGSIKSKK